MPEDNTFLGEFKVEGLSKAPQGNPIVTTFSLDLNGMLHVTARELKKRATALLELKIDPSNARRAAKRPTPFRAALSPASAASAISPS